MKKIPLISALALGVMTSVAAAEAVKLTDAQMDNATAGGPVNVIVVTGDILSDGNTVLVYRRVQTCVDAVCYQIQSNDPKITNK